MVERAPWPFPDFRRRGNDAHVGKCRCPRCEHDRSMDEMGEIAVAEAAAKAAPANGTHEENAMPEPLIGLPVVDAMPERERPRAALVGGTTTAALDNPGMVRAAVAAAHSQAEAEVIRIRATLARMELEQGALRAELAAQMRHRSALSDWLTTDAFGSART